uniref:Uncharacterized protein n=1 Tax=Octopus bimaculoides TaxID=37653 RepID=A0A0L8GVA8_OCTBM
MMMEQHLERSWTCCLVRTVYNYKDCLVSSIFSINTKTEMRILFTALSSHVSQTTVSIISVCFEEVAVEAATAAVFAGIATVAVDAAVVM